MELSLTVLTQVLVMFLLIIIGFVAQKTKLANETGRKQLTNILLYIVSPLLIIDAYHTAYTKELAKNLVVALFLGVISHLIAMAIAYIFIRKRGNEKNASIERFAVIYSNCGFMAIPLVQALFGSEGVFYASAYMLVFQALSWTHGYVMMSGKFDKKTLKEAFLSPVFISVILGLVIFFSQTHLPTVISSTVKHMAALNTPVAMLVTGITLAETKLLDAFKRIRCYYIVFLACVLVPIVTMAIYLLFPALPTKIVLVNLIATACPCAVLTLLFSSRFGLDEEYSVHILTLCNIFCIVTIPAIVLLYQALQPALHSLLP